MFSSYQNVFVIESLKNLTTLDLSSNRISSLGTSIVGKTVIKQMDRQTNRKETMVRKTV